MEHTDFPKIFQTFLPIIIFILWAMFSNAGKKRKTRNYPVKEKPKPDSWSMGSPELEKTPYHKAPEKELESKAKPNPVNSSANKAAVTSQLPQHQWVVRAPASPDLQVRISSAPGTSGPAPVHDYGRYSLGELQKLVVWSEILNKPIALRDRE
jgi:hypothetical protein